MFDFEKHDVKFEEILFYKLIVSKDFRSTVMPILKQEYFNLPQGEFPYNLLFKYVEKSFNDNIKEIDPTLLIHSIEEYEKYIDPDNVREIRKTLKQIFSYDQNTDSIVNDIDLEYVIRETEKFAQEKAIELALFEAVDILKERPHEKQSIATLLSDALNVSIERDIGLNYNDDARSRFEYYQQREDKIPFALDVMNKITFGGFPRKTLNCFMAGTGIGKTLIMSSLVTDYVKLGYDILYVSLEISEERIALRNDANLMNIPIGDFGKKNPDNTPFISTDVLVQKFEAINNSNFGKLRIKEYPTSSINTQQIKSLIKELKNKEDFTADVVVIDYINLVNSSRLSGKTSNSYSIVKAVAEELRGIAVEENIVIITATQTNRDGISGGEVALDKVSESAGLPQTTDFFCGIFQSEKQREEGIIVIKPLKNRYSAYVNVKMGMGIDYNFMRIYQLDANKESEIEAEVEDSDNDNNGSKYVRKNRKRG